MNRTSGMGVSSGNASTGRECSADAAVLRITEGETRLMLEPFPTEVRPADDPDNEEELSEAPRMLFCTLYERCLDYAVKQRWENWTCAQCSLASKQARRPRAQEFASCGRKENG
ncbi:MAG TPA: hypothetical protein VKE49_09180, partial [Myxococcaceae bacterium]|nr:hypothetical protein [Myxococcaceae bacterium]